MIVRLPSLIIIGCIIDVRATPVVSLGDRAGITTLSAAQIASYKPYTYYARAAGCGTAATKAWSCGESCSKNPSFRPTASGGDGELTQFWYVGHDPTLQTVIVSHQGTDTSKLGAIAIDLDLDQVNLNSTLFPGMNPAVKVHKGFSESHSRAALSVLAAVRKTLEDPSVKKHVTTVGHSLGAALALLDAVYLPLHLPGVSFSAIGYGMPRVGNQAFADYVDAHVKVTRINNKQDPVPTLPGRSMGFHHPSGEIHISNTGTWFVCPGQDNPASQCTVGSVLNFFMGDFDDHSGPYDGVEFHHC